MASQTLFIVASDPRTSPRPAEAVRIAAGVAAWKKTNVRLYLHGPAILALGEWVDELVDEDNFTRYLPILADGAKPVLVEAGAPEIGELGQASLAFQPVDSAELSRCIASSRQVLRF